MTRVARTLSETGMYHIIFRGINKETLFFDNLDFRKLLEIIDIIKNDLDFDLYAYCLMSNHTHLFIKEKNQGDIKQIMKRILTRYAMWYNKRYDRSGPVIGNRYKSEPIEDDEYLLALIKYIHMNPVKAGIVQNPANYMWSSYNDYLDNSPSLTDTEFIMTLFAEKCGNPYVAFNDLHSNTDDIDFSISDTKTLTDEQAKRKIQHIIKIEPRQIAFMTVTERNQIISNLRKQGFTIRQLVNITGIPKSIIEKIK